jgi:RNA polymerase sigma-70 factor (ECF subfamily)
MFSTTLRLRWSLGSLAASAAGLPVSLRRLANVVLAQRPQRAASSPAAEAGLPGASGSEEDWSDVQASLRGDGDAFARLVRRYQGPVGAYLWRFTRDRSQWEELVQEVFVEAFFSLRSYQARAPLLHWLRRIATRTGYRWWRTRDRRRTPPTVSLENWDQALQAEDSQEAAADAGRLVHAALDRLAPRDRLVLTLMYLDGCSLEEIAQLTGWSRTMIKVQAHRARRRLGKVLEEERIRR